MLDFYRIIYRLNNHEKSFLCKRLNFAISPKNIKYSDYLLLFRLLFRDVKIINYKKNVNSRLRDYAYSFLNRFQRYQTKIYYMRK